MKKSIVMTIVCVILLTVGFAIAQTYNINNSTVNIENIEQEPQLSAMVGPDVYERWYFYDGVISESPINIELTQSATSTTGNPAPAGYWCNDTNQNLLVEGNWYADLQTANGRFGSNWTIGTTTLNDGGFVWTPGTNSFTATATATLMPSTAITSSTTGFYDRDTRTQLGTWYDGGGNATTSPFRVDKGVCVVMHSDHSGATSSASYTSAGGFTTFVGGFHMTADIR